jgi:hypothetical protein
MTEETPGQTGPEQGRSDPGTPGSGAEDVPGADSPSQEEIRARLEEQIRRLRVEDLMVESVVSLLNLTARRIAKEDERDLEQGKVGIEAIRAWVDLLPEEAATQIRNALSELQVIYANAVEGGPTPPDRGGGGAEARSDPGAPGSGEQQPQQPKRGDEPPPRLWTPHGSD